MAGTDRNGTLLWVDEPFSELTGYSSAELEDRPFTTLSDPADAEKVQQYLKRAAGQPQAFEMQLIDGRGELHVIRVTAVPSANGDQSITLGLQDITEEEALRRRITFTEKTDLITRLMQAIGGDLSRSLKELGPPDEADGNGKGGALKRLISLQQRIERFPVRGIREGTEVDLGALFQDILEGELDAWDLSGVALEVEGDLPEVFGNSSEIRRAAEQVLLNALEATGQGGGGVTVRLERADVGRGESHRGFILPPGIYARLVIIDEGPGILPEILDHVFEPLFSTRTDRPLAGLGLAAAYAVVKNHRGYIDIQSVPGSGTTVEIFLPRSRVREQMVVTEEPEAGSLSGAQTEAPPSREADALADAAAWPESEDEELEVEAEAADGSEAEETEGSGLAPLSEEPPAGSEEEVERPPDLTEPVTASGGEVPAEAVPEAAAEAEEAPPPPEPQEELTEDQVAILSGDETILVVEEDVDARKMVADSLGQLGYNVLPARNWVEGVDLFKRHGRLVNLVMVNVQVPEMVWVKTLMDLRKVDSAAPVALMGDEERTPTMERYLAMEGITYLTKPLTMSSLLKGVRGALDEGSEASG